METITPPAVTDPDEHAAPPYFQDRAALYEATVREHLARRRAAAA
jgi:hypothetical protein